MAHRLELVHELGEAEQRRHRAERLPAEILGEAGGNHPGAASDQRVDRVDDPEIEELGLVDADRV